MELIDHSLPKIKSDLLEHRASFNIQYVLDPAVEQNHGKVDPAQFQEKVDTCGIDSRIDNTPLQFQRYDPERRQNGGH